MDFLQTGWCYLCLTYKFLTRIAHASTLIFEFHAILLVLNYSLSHTLCKPEITTITTTKLQNPINLKLHKEKKTTGEIQDFTQHPLGKSGICHTALDSKEIERGKKLLIHVHI